MHTLFVIVQAASTQAGQRPSPVLVPALKTMTAPDRRLRRNDSRRAIMA
jgi:hypothetical protein